jgi:hypothetical protein
MRPVLIVAGILVVLGAIGSLVRQRDDPRFVSDLFGDVDHGRRRAAETTSRSVAGGWRADAWLRERPMWVGALILLTVTLVGLIGLLVGALRNSA